MRQFLSFNGKADRFEWWAVSLITDLVAQLGLLFGWIVAMSDVWYRVPAAGVLFLAAVFALWAAIAVSVRRINDRERSPWFLVFALVPMVGWIWLVIECGILPAPGPRVRKEFVRRFVTAPAKEV
jgi:uncharacterized membrane protein YhaH (DUF805 family)